VPIITGAEVVAALGFTADIGPGDITAYPGKVRLISVGFGEAATAVHNAAVALDPSASLFPGHSTDAEAARP
jgi:hypothetical protein